MSTERESSRPSKKSSRLYAVGTPKRRSLTDELAAVPARDRARIESDILALASDPYPRQTKHLERNIFRIRRGNWRVIYQVIEDEGVVLIGAIRRRGPHTYRRIETLFDE